MTAKLVITIPIDAGQLPGDEESITQEAARAVIRTLFQESEGLDRDTIQLALLRDGDRSGGNLLLPRLEGRLGNHLQGRKATLREVLER